MGEPIEEQLEEENIAGATLSMVSGFTDILPGGRIGIVCCGGIGPQTPDRLGD